MGCGSSKHSRVVSPFSKALVLPHLAWAGNKSSLKPIMLKKRPEGLLVDLGIQVEQAFELVDTMTQTDVALYPDEEFEDSCFGDSQEPNISDVETQTSVTTPPGSETVKSIKVQTDSQKNNLRRNRSDRNSQTESKISVDIGVQAVTSKMSHFTQTDRQPSSRLGSVQSSGMSSTHTSGRKTTMSIRPNTLTKSDFEPQTYCVSEALPENTDSDTKVLYTVDMTSPFAHIERELNTSFSTSRNHRTRKGNIHESIARLLEDVEDTFRYDSNLVTKLGYKCSKKTETAVQTDNDPITDEAPEFAARPPPCKKKEMIPNPAIFREMDQHALQAPESARSSIRNLVNYLTQGAKNDLQKIRAFFRWIASNVTYNWKYIDVRLTAEEVLHRGEGVCKDYCKLFSEMCRFANIRVKTLQGFAKGHDYRPGHQFHPGEDVTHAWNAIFIFGAWRLIDTTWGTGYTDHTGKFQKKLNEHFFLTDPEALIWTHFPHDELENDYCRWQLLDKPITLEHFNALPKVTPFFFQYNLKIRSRPQNPVKCKVQTEIKLGAHEPMRYKFKMYPADELENSSLNNYVFCQLKEDRLVGSFVVSPPIEGRYYFKVYAKPENEMSDDTTLHSVIIFLVECERARKYIQPYPLNEVPWGPTQSFFNFNMKLINQSGPLIVTWGGRRKVTLEMSTSMLITPQMFDADGMELDLKSVLLREDHDNRVTFTILPFRVGLYKLMIFGMPKPKQKGKWRLPLIASFLIDCKLTKQNNEDDLPSPTERSARKKASKTNKKIRIVPVH